MSHEVNAAAAARWEGSCALQFLPGCRNVLADGQVCGTRHPLAYNPPMPADRCPRCGAPVAAPGPTVVEPALVSAPVPLAARVLIAIGRWFRWFSRKG